MSAKPIPPDSPRIQLSQLWEFIEMHGDGFSAENWAIVEEAMNRVSRIVVEAERWAHAYESSSSDSRENELWRTVRIEWTPDPVKAPRG